MNNLLQLMRQLEIQLLLAIIAFLLLSWPVITGKAYGLGQLYYYLFGVWALIPLLRCLPGSLSGHRGNRDTGPDNGN